MAGEIGVWSGLQVRGRSIKQRCGLKLINRTYRLTALWLIPVLLLGSVFTFYTIQYINYEETDEFLTYEMQRLERYYQDNFDLPEFHGVADILPGKHYAEPVFKDTMMLEPADNEWVPYRELHFSIEHKGKSFGIVLRQIMPGTDDILEGALLIVFGIMLLVVLFVLLGVRQINAVIWRPFYQTIEKIRGFKVGEAIPDFSKTPTTEFTELNAVVESWLTKVSTDYQSNKEFNENVSHELQTHLAVIRSKANELLNTKGATQQEAEALQVISKSVARLTAFQKSLLLLSKITNQEFQQTATVNLKKFVQEALDIYDEAISLRRITLSFELEDCPLRIDPGLAAILANNLIKNAVKHNVEGGSIAVKLTGQKLEITNSGLPFEGDPERMFGRFVRGEEGNLGIGLAIVDQVCRSSGFSLQYKVNETSKHRVIVTFRRD